MIRFWQIYYCAPFAFDRMRSTFSSKLHYAMRWQKHTIFDIVKAIGAGRNTHTQREREEIYKNYLWLKLNVAVKCARSTTSISSPYVSIQKSLAIIAVTTDLHRMWFLSPIGFVTDKIAELLIFFIIVIAQFWFDFFLFHSMCRS